MIAPTPLTLAELDRPGSHWTAREIAQQPAMWREVAAVVESSRQDAERFLAPLLARADLRVVLTGAGTSAFVGEVLAPGLARQLDRRVDVVATTDIVSNPREVFAQDRPTLLVSFARSGASPESLAATELADQVLSECHHLVITCDATGRLYQQHAGRQRSLAVLMPEGTNDRGFAMTSSFTSMLFAGWLLLTGAPAGPVAEQLAVAADQLLGSGVAQAAGAAAASYERIVYLGSGALKGLARESALKMLELTAGSVVTTFDSPMGFRHGPKAVLNDRTLVVVYVSNDLYTRRYDLDVVAEIREALDPRNVLTVSASLDQDPHTGGGTWQLDGVDAIPDALVALPFVIVAQLLGLFFSVARGMKPDNPFPSGEVNRVVKGVIIHPLDEEPTGNSSSDDAPSDPDRTNEVHMKGTEMDSVQGTGLKPTGVRAAVHATTWQEAVDVAGAVLTRAGVCTDDYVQAMKDAVRDLGPYMVIAPGVAMPHARPESGVLRPGTAVVTLAEPVEFGNPANDPVDLVIAFAALDKNAHLKSLQRITELLMDEAALERVRNATTDEELLSALSGDSTGGGEAS